jgi:hypothetical protein
MPSTRSDFWTDWQRMEADRRHLIAKLRDRTKVITRADLTAIARQLEHCTPVPDFTGDTGCAGLTADPDATDCEPAFAGLPAAWRATAAELGQTTQDVALATALRRCADELDAALPTL